MRVATEGLYATWASCDVVPLGQCCYWKQVGRLVKCVFYALLEAWVTGRRGKGRVVVMVHGKGEDAV